MPLIIFSQLLIHKINNQEFLIMKILEISAVLYKALLTRLITSVIVGFVSVSAFANNVNELAQGCYAIQSPGTGKYLDQKKNPIKHIMIF